MADVDTTPGDRLVSSSLSLLLSNATGAVLGVVFWIIAAHRYSPQAVGNGSAEIAAMTLTATTVQFAPALVFNRFLYRSGTLAPRVVRIGYVFAIVAAAVGATVFLLVSGRHPYILGGVVPKFTFIAAVMLWVMFSVEDAVLVGLREMKWIPLENTIFSLLKLGILVAIAGVLPKTGVFDAWITPLLLLIIPVNWLIFRRLLPRHAAAANGHNAFPESRALRRQVLGEYAGTLMVIGLGSLPSLLVVRELGSEAAAYFQTPWLVGTSLDFLVWTLSSALGSEVNARPDHGPASVRRLVRYSWQFGLPLLLTMAAVAPFGLRILGPAYAAHGTRLLLWLLAGCPFMALNVLYITFARLGRRVRRIFLIQFSMALLVLATMISLLHSYGETGAGMDFFFGQAAIGLAVTPSLVRQFRRPSMAPGFAPTSALLVLPESER
jgi:O-antigen/teichoic acid export membrane protein